MVDVALRTDEGPVLRRDPDRQEKSLLWWLRPGHSLDRWANRQRVTTGSALLLLVIFDNW
jgi:hypothetical protein